MSYTPGVGVDVTVGINIGHKESVNLSANRLNGLGDLSIGNKGIGIRLAPNHLETLRDQLPGVLAELGVLDAAEERANDAGSRAHELERYLRDQAAAADAAGESERAGVLREGADRLKARMDRLESALEALSTAASDADDASGYAQMLLDEQVAAKDQPTGGDAA